MTEDVQACRSGHHRGLAACVVGVDDAQSRLQVAMSDSRFSLSLHEIKDRHARRLASRAGRCRNGDHGLQRSWNGATLSNGSVDIG